MSIVSPGNPTEVTNRYPPGEVARVILVVLAFGMGAYVLWRIQEVLFLLFVAILLATAIEPIVNRLRRGPFSRGSGVLVVYTALMLVLGVAGYLVVPNVLSQAAAFAPSMPDRLQALRGELAQLDQPILRNAVVGLVDQAQVAVRAQPQPKQDDLIAVGAVAIQTIVGFLSVFVLAFYWLVERATISASSCAMFRPHAHAA